MILSTITSIFIFITTVVAIIILGRAINSWVFVDHRNKSLGLQNSLAYFSGIIAIQSGLRIGSLAFGFKLASFITFATLLIFTLVNIKEIRLVKFNPILISTYGLILLFLPIYWMSANPQEMNPFSNIGSLHSVRYAWLSNFIQHCDRIPILGQNFGQSILTAFFGTAWSPRPYLFLLLWLYTGILISTMFFHELISEFTKKVVA